MILHKQTGNVGPTGPSGAGIVAGIVAFFGASSAPTGWLECNGAAVSRTTYATLFAVVGTAYNTGGEAGTDFRLPDLRGEFVRGWDHGRGVDSGRALGSAQADEIKAHTHTLTASTTGTDIDRNDGEGPSCSSPESITTSSTGGTETRPRNVALLACIKT